MEFQPFKWGEKRFRLTDLKLFTSQLKANDAKHDKRFIKKTQIYANKERQEFK
jgi:hypothetical protein